jgi:hypothetical protein
MIRPSGSLPPAGLPKGVFLFFNYYSPGVVRLVPAWLRVRSTKFSARVKGMVPEINRERSFSLVQKDLGKTFI